MTSAIGYILVLVFTNGLSVSSLAPTERPYATFDQCKGAGEFSKRQSPKRLDSYLCAPIFGPADKSVPTLDSTHSP